MKTHHLFAASFLFIMFSAFAQVGSTEEKSNSTYTSSQKKYKPVFFDFKKRKLLYDGNQRMSGEIFLNMCRNINDSAIQYQIHRYDALTKQKAIMLAAMGVNGVFGLLAVNVAMTNYGGSSGGTPMLASAGAIALISAPILAITMRVPHQKRKEILFRDLPIAYNQFVEAQENLAKN